jgi:hypothetical protein
MNAAIASTGACGVRLMRSHRREGTVRATPSGGNPLQVTPAHVYSMAEPLTRRSVCRTTEPARDPTHWPATEMLMRRPEGLEQDLRGFPIRAAGLIKARQPVAIRAGFGCIPAPGQHALPGRCKKVAFAARGSANYTETGGAARI